MTKYIPVESENYAKYISSLIYKLTRPDSTVDDVTLYAISWVFDINNNCYLTVNYDSILPIHPNRTTDIETAIRDLQLQNKITESSADLLLNIVSSNSGGTITISQIIPSEWDAVAVETIEQPEPL